VKASTSLIVLHAVDMECSNIVLYPLANATAPKEPRRCVLRAGCRTVPKCWGASQATALSEAQPMHSVHLNETWEHLLLQFPSPISPGQVRRGAAYTSGDGCTWLTPCLAAELVVPPRSMCSP